MERINELRERKRQSELEKNRELFNLFHADLVTAAWECESISDDDFAKGFTSCLYAESADIDEFVPAEFKHLVEDYESMPNPDNVRCCSHCGRPMKEGYYLAGDYACSETCAINLYHGNKEQFESDLEQDEIHNYGEVYYTEWTSYYFE